MKNIDTDNPAELDRFCKYITDVYNITLRPEEYDKEEWKNLSNKEKEEHFIKKSFFEFLNEYMARIYNGALGNIPLGIEKKLKEAVAKQNGSVPPYRLDEIYHKPTDEELQILKQMKWKGVPILKI